PFGMLVPNRHEASESYRYGFQEQEKDDELKGEGNSINYAYRMYDPRVGRFFATDPLTAKFPFYSPYQFSGNRPLDAIELEGLEDSFEIRSRRRDEAYLSGKISTDKYIQEQRAESVGGIIGASILVDVILTKGWLSRSIVGGALLESINESERGYEAQRNGNQKEAQRRFNNAAEASKVVIFGIAAEGAAAGFVRISKIGSSINVAFGKDVNLRAFAKKYNVKSFHDWKEQVPGYLESEKNFENFADAFKFIADKVKKTNGKIKFNLEHVNIQDALKIKPETGLMDQVNGAQSLWEKGKITEWELSQILNDKKLLKATEFYKMGKKVPVESIKKMAK
ncbi:RHS repeat-associated core domain-containing protein, partial [uncultured Flavobacterium sp.]